MESYTRMKPDKMQDIRSKKTLISACNGTRPILEPAYHLKPTSTSDVHVLHSLTGSLSSIPSHGMLTTKKNLVLLLQRPTE